MPVSIGIFLAYCMVVRMLGHIASGRPLLPRDGKYRNNGLVETARDAVRDGALVLFFFVVSLRPSTVWSAADAQYGDHAALSRP